MLNAIEVLGPPSGSLRQTQRPVSFDAREEIVACKITGLKRIEFDDRNQAGFPSTTEKITDGLQRFPVEVSDRLNYDSAAIHGYLDR